MKFNHSTGLKSILINGNVGALEELIICPALPFPKFTANFPNEKLPVYHNLIVR